MQGIELIQEWIDAHCPTLNGWTWRATIEQGEFGGVRICLEERRKEGKRYQTNRMISRHELLMMLKAVTDFPSANGNPAGDAAALMQLIRCMLLMIPLPRKLILTEQGQMILSSVTRSMAHGAVSQQFDEMDAASAA